MFIAKIKTKEILISERTDIAPLLGIDWMKPLKPTIGRIHMAENSQSEKEKLFIVLPDIFENIEKIKDTKINIQDELGHYPIEQNARPVKLPLQEDVGREVETLIKTEPSEKINHVDQVCFKLLC